MPANCPNCHTALRPGARFCANCGKTVSSDDGGVEKCIHCGAALRPGARFCANCGSTLEASKPVAPVTPAQPSGSGAPIPPTQQVAFPYPPPEPPVVPMTQQAGYSQPAAPEYYPLPTPIAQPVILPEPPMITTRKKNSRLWVVGAILLFIIVLAAIVVAPILLDQPVEPTVVIQDLAATLTAAAPVIP